MAKNLRHEHYEYADQIAKILGFTGLGDYQTGCRFNLLDTTTVDAVNQTLDRFKKLFLQHDFNLSRSGGKIGSVDQLTGFFKKILTILHIPYELQRIEGITHLRLKPDNKLLRDFINMSTGCQKMQMPVNPIKPKFLKASAYLEKYCKGEVLHKKVFYKGSVSLGSLLSRNTVITEITVATDSTLRMGYCIYELSAGSTPLILPMHALVYSTLDLDSRDPNFVELTVSYKITSHLLNINKWNIELDSTLFCKNPTRDWREHVSLFEGQAHRGGSSIENSVELPKCYYKDVCIDGATHRIKYSTEEEVHWTTLLRIEEPGVSGVETTEREQKFLYYVDTEDSRQIYYDLPRCGDVVSKITFADKEQVGDICIEIDQSTRLNVDNQHAFPIIRYSWSNISIVCKVPLGSKIPELLVDYIYLQPQQRLKCATTNDELSGPIQIAAKHWIEKDDM